VPTDALVNVIRGSNERDLAKFKFNDGLIVG